MVTVQDLPPPELERSLRVVPNDDTEAPPADVISERALLSALLNDPTTVANTAGHLEAADFYQPRHGTIWDALHTATAGGITDPNLTRERVISALITTGEARHVPYLAELITTAGDPLYLDAYTENVRNAARLRSVAETARKVIQVTTTRDLSRTNDALAHLYDVVADAAIRYGKSTDTTPNGLRDLSWLAAGQWPVIDPPAWGQRTDGHALFYSGRVNGIFGDPESAKTWIAKWTGLQAIQAGKCFAMVDVDHNGQELTVSQLLLLGAQPTDLANPNLFRYYEPDDGGELHAAIADIVDLAPAVVCLDSIGEMLPMLGVKSVDNDEITGALRAIASAPAKAGCCVITIDHLPKGTDARASGYAIGGTAKKRALDGAYIFAKTVLPPAPGQLGKVALWIEKDRPGELRKSCNGNKRIGEFVLDSRTENITKASVVANHSSEAGEFIPTHFMERVSRIVEERDGVTTNELCKDIRGKAEHIRLAINHLIAGGYISTTQGSRNSTKHHHIQPYRETEETEDEPMF